MTLEKYFKAAAYFEVEVRGFDQEIMNTKYFDVSGIKIRKAPGSKLRKIFGNVSINVEVDNSFKTMIVAYVKQGGEYRRMPYKVANKGTCDFYNDDEYVYPELAAHSDLPLPFPCPLSPVRSFRCFSFI